MRDPVAFAAHHPRLAESSCAGWALEVLLSMHTRRLRRSYPFQRRSDLKAVVPEVRGELRKRRIESRLDSYGNNWPRFEAALEKTRKDGALAHPLISVPAIAEIDWRTGSLHIRAKTFLVSYDGTLPVFITRDPHAPSVSRISLKQMRLLHRTWRRWPVVLPSMLLTVLWHWPVAD